MEIFPIAIVWIVLGLIIVECALGAFHDLPVYEVKDTFASLVIGSISLAVNLGYKGFTFHLLSVAYHYSLFDFGKSPLVWLAAFLISDFIHYWFHWLGHKSRFFWAAHMVHHSSSRYNFATAIRTPVMNFSYRFLFNLPMCFLGFRPEMVMVAESAIFLYNFWLHTQMIGKLGWFEYIFNTPSHHRVHHGKDSKYIDKNYGGILIIWDRMFGTFQGEAERPTYGLMKEIKSHNPIIIIFKEWREMMTEAAASNSLRDALIILFRFQGRNSNSNATERCSSNLNDSLMSGSYSPTLIAKPENKKINL